jgi:hypothetical protein
MLGVFLAEAVSVVISLGSTNNSKHFIDRLRSWSGRLVITLSFVIFVPELSNTHPSLNSVFGSPNSYHLNLF